MGTPELLDIIIFMATVLTEVVALYILSINTIIYNNSSVKREYES